MSTFYAFFHTFFCLPVENIRAYLVIKLTFFRPLGKKGTPDVSRGFSLFQSLFQSRGAQGCQENPVQAVFRRQHEGFGKIVTGNHFAVLLCFG